MSLLKHAFFFLLLTQMICLSYGQDSINTMWRCGPCNENQCKPQVMYLNQCSEVCSPCTGVCDTKAYYMLKPSTPGTYTISQYSNGACLNVEFSHLVEPDSCKTTETQCSRVYLPNGGLSLIPSVIVVLFAVFFLMISY